jgi:hypothetical protein
MTSIFDDRKYKPDEDRKDQDEDAQQLEFSDGWLTFIWVFVCILTCSQIRVPPSERTMLVDQ